MFKPEGCIEDILFSALTQLALVDLASWLDSSSHFLLTGCQRHRDFCSSLWPWFSVTICLHRCQAPDASKLVLLEQIRQSSVWACSEVWQLPETGSRKEQMNACHLPEIAVWSPTFLVWYWKQSREMSRSSWKWLLLNKGKRPDSNSVM